MLTQITQARSETMHPSRLASRPSQNHLSRVSGTCSPSQNYPELRSNTVLIDFQEELSSTEKQDLLRQAALQRLGPVLQHEDWRLPRGHLLPCHGLHREGILPEPGAGQGVRAPVSYD